MKKNPIFTYILMASEGFGLPQIVAYPAGACFAAALFAVYLVLSVRKAAKENKR